MNIENQSSGEKPPITLQNLFINPNLNPVPNSNLTESIDVDLNSVQLRDRQRESTDSVTNDQNSTDDEIEDHLKSKPILISNRPNRSSVQIQKTGKLHYNHNYLSVTKSILLQFVS